MRRRIWCDFESGFWEEVDPDHWYWRFGMNVSVEDGSREFVASDAEHSPEVLYDDAVWDRYLAACRELHFAKEAIRASVVQETPTPEEFARAKAAFEKSERWDAHYREYGTFPEGDEY